MSLSLLRFSITAILMMALTGCFSVDLTAPDTVEQNSVFSMSATPKNSEGAVNYQWSLNEKVISENATHHTMLPALGEYTLTVVAIDEKGNEDTQSKTISVVAQPSLNPNFSFAINVSDKAGFALTDVPVSVNGTTVVTDQYGLAQFEGISQTSLMLVSASKEGYLTQTYQYNFDAAQESAQANLTLQSINPVSHTVDSNAAIDITETELHTKLILAANSFVDASGNAVTGDVEITITPVDVRAVDNAFLGGAQALTSAGEAVALISTGMADYQFSQNGTEISLAEGATAIIEMDLVVTTGDDGRVFAEGDTIEMWWFDSETGFWIEDGVGTVALSNTSETGLKLVATVTHFTTWNWDYYMQSDRSKITFNCLKDGQPLATNESCEITASSTTINRQFIASSAGVTAINTAPNVTYSVVANSTAGGSLWAGETSFTSVPGNNTVTVNMSIQESKTGYIQCRVINDALTSIAPCNSIIASGSIGNQYIDSADFNNYRASFNYIQGDVLDISSVINGGLNQKLLVETATVNGTLDIEVVFDVQFGSLQCSATLDGIDAQFFPCETLVTGNDGSEFIIFEQDFNGVPPKADFTYSQGAQGLFFQIASVFDNAKIEDYGSDGIYYFGEGTEIYVDLAIDLPNVTATYNILSENLYTFECLNDFGIAFDCAITWYDSYENIIFDGYVSDLTDPNRLPLWINGKFFFKGSVDGFGYAEYVSGDQYYYSRDYVIDPVSRVIRFTLVEDNYPQ